MRMRSDPPPTCQHTSAYASICQHMSAYVSICQHTSAHVSIRQHTSLYVSIRQHTSAYVSIRQHTSAYVKHLSHAVILVPLLLPPRHAPPLCHAPPPPRLALRHILHIQAARIRHASDSIRRHTSAYVQHTSSIRQHTPAPAHQSRAHHRARFGTGVPATFTTSFTTNFTRELYY